MGMVGAGKGNCMNMIEREVRVSPRPNGTRKRGHDAIPGLRCAYPGLFSFLPSGKGAFAPLSGNEWTHNRQRESLMQLPWGAGLVAEENGWRMVQFFLSRP